MKKPFSEVSYFSWYVCATALVILGLVLVAYGQGSSREDTVPPGVVSGTIADDVGPVAGATVRIQGTENQTVTDARGRFALSEVPAGHEVNISAWKKEYYCFLSKNVAVPAEDVRLHLIHYQTNDNPGYEWIPPKGKGGCSDCHNPAIIEMSLEDAHLKSARNPRFLTMYYGRDMGGNQSPVTRYGPGSAIWKTVLVPQLPDPSQPYYGPGYLLDFPEISHQVHRVSYTGGFRSRGC